MATLNVWPVSIASLFFPEPPSATPTTDEQLGEKCHTPIPLFS